MFSIDSAKVRDFVARHGWTLAQFADAAKLNKITCRKLLGGGQVSMRVISRISALMDAPASALIVCKE